MSAQSVQQVVKDFCDTLTATTAARKAQKIAGLEVTTKYPWRSAHYRNVPYTNQDAVLRGGILRLSHGRGGTQALSLRFPKKLPLPGRLMEVQLAYGVIRIVCEVGTAPDAPQGLPVGVDLGVNTLIAATDGTTAVVVSGREAKAIVRYQNKANAELRSRIDRAKRGSKRHKKLVRARHKMADKGARKLRDVLHKATRIVADAFPNSPVVVGKPFNHAARKMGRVTAQQVSQASNAKIIALLAYKMAGTTEVPEPYSSQTCPGCGGRQKCRRVYKCKACGLVLPRDVVGSTNILRIKIPEATIPSVIRFARPSRKYRGASKVAPRSSGGIPAREVANTTQRVTRGAAMPPRSLAL